MLIFLSNLIFEKPFLGLRGIHIHKGCRAAESWFRSIHSGCLWSVRIKLPGNNLFYGFQVAESVFHVGQQIASFHPFIP